MSDFDEEYLFRNVQDLREKLKVTEKSLDQIKVIESKNLHNDFEPPPSPPLHMPVLSLEDLTPPEHFLKSENTKQKRGQMTSRRYSPTLDFDEREGKFDFDTNLNNNMNGDHWKYDSYQRSGLRHHGDSESKRPRSSSNDRSFKRMHDRSNSPDTRMHRSPSPVSPTVSLRRPKSAPEQTTSVDIMDHQFEQLQRRMRKVQTENNKLVDQNQKMILQLENTGHELHQNKLKIQETVTELRMDKSNISDLHHKIDSLVMENNSVSKSMRSIEEKYDKTGRDLMECRAESKMYQEEVQRLRSQFQDESIALKRCEAEKEETSHTIEELQQALQEHQKNSREKLKQYQFNFEKVKENLLHVEDERDRFLGSNNKMKASIHELQEHFRIAQDKHQSEKENRARLGKQIEELKVQINSLQVKAKTAEVLQQENSELKVVSQKQKERICQCEDEISETRVQLERLEQLGNKLRAKQQQYTGRLSDSGVSCTKTHLRSSGSRRRSLETSYTELYRPSEAGLVADAANIISELRTTMSMQDTEIQKLRDAHEKCDLVVEAHMGCSGTIDALRREIDTQEERNRIGEQSVKMLEEDRAQHTGKILKLESKLSDLEVRNAALEVKLNQKSSQVAQIQNDAQDKNDEAVALEREMRKRKQQIITLERQLDEKVHEISEHVTRIHALEEDLDSQKMHIRKLSSDMEDKGQDIYQYEMAMNKIKQLQKEQCMELQTQVEIAQRNCEDRTEETMELQRVVSEQKQKLLVAEGRLAESQREMRQRTEQHGSAMNVLEQQLSDGMHQVRHLESSLSICKEELILLQEQMEEARASNAEKEKRIKDLETQIKQLERNLSERALRIKDLEDTEGERQEMLQHSDLRINELEDAQMALQKQVSNAEKNYHKEVARLREESKTLDKKLHQACLDLERKNLQVQETQRKIKEVEEEKSSLKIDRNEMEKLMREEKQDSERRRDRIALLEDENRKYKQEIKEIDEKGHILKDELERSKSEYKTLNQQTILLKMELDKKQNELHHEKLRVEEGETKLSILQEDDMKKTSTLEDMREKLRESERQIKKKTYHVEELEKLAKEQQLELKKKAGQVGQLDVAIQSHRSQTDKRVIQLEAALKKSQHELESRCEQIESLDDELDRHKIQLKESTLRLQQLDHSSKMNLAELEKKENKQEELERHLESMKSQIQDLQVEESENGKQLRQTKEQLQRLHLEYTEAKQEISMINREKEKLEHEAGSLRNEVEDKKEKLHTAKSKESSIGEKYESEIKRLKHELEKIQDLHTKQLKEMQDLQRRLVREKDDLASKVQSRMGEFTEKEQYLMREIERGQQDIRNLQHEIMSNRQIIDATNEGLVLKDAEIVRLEARLSRNDRAAAAAAIAMNISNNGDLMQSYDLAANTKKREKSHQRPVIERLHLMSDTESNVHDTCFEDASPVRPKDDGSDDSYRSLHEDRGKSIALKSQQQNRDMSMAHSLPIEHQQKYDMDKKKIISGSSPPYHPEMGDMGQRHDLESFQGMLEDVKRLYTRVPETTKHAKSRLIAALNNASPRKAKPPEGAQKKKTMTRTDRDKLHKKSSTDHSALVATQSLRDSRKHEHERSRGNKPPHGDPHSKRYQHNSSSKRSQGPKTSNDGVRSSSKFLYSKRSGNKSYNNSCISNPGELMQYPISSAESDSTKTAVQMYAGRVSMDSTDVTINEATVGTVMKDMGFDHHHFLHPIRRSSSVDELLSPQRRQEIQQEIDYSDQLDQQTERMAGKELDMSHEKIAALVMQDRQTDSN